MTNLTTKQSIEGRKLSIVTPLIEMNKAQIIQQSLTLGVDYSLTITCYQASDNAEACGFCDACEYRKLGFKSVGITNPTKYQ